MRDASGAKQSIGIGLQLDSRDAVSTTMSLVKERIMPVLPVVGCVIEVSTLEINLKGCSRENMSGNDKKCESKNDMIDKWRNHI